MTELISITKRTCVNLVPAFLYFTKLSPVLCDKNLVYSLQTSISIYKWYNGIILVYARRIFKRHGTAPRLSKRKEVKLMLNDAYLLCLMRDGCVKCGKKNIIKINRVNRSLLGCDTIDRARHCVGEFVLQFLLSSIF